MTRYRERRGLDRPIIEQYANYWRAMLSGNLGRSFVGRRGVFTVAAERLPKTLLPTSMVLALALLVGLPADTLAAMRHTSLFDRAVIAMVVAGYGLPTFSLELLTILLFAVEQRLLPSSARSHQIDQFLPELRRIGGSK